MTGPSEVGAVSIAGTRMPLNLDAGFSDLAFGGNRLTVDGQEFTLTGGIDGPISMLLSFAGSAVLPPLGTQPALVRAPFTMEGSLFFSPFGPTHQLSGRGVVEVSLLEGALPNRGPAWLVDAIRWEFQDSDPVPEPGTLFLVASGIATLAGMRHRAVVYLGIRRVQVPSFVASAVSQAGAGVPAARARTERSEPRRASAAQ